MSTLDDKAYPQDKLEKKVNQMNFSEALTLLKQGKKLARENWNAGGQFVYMVPAASYKAQTEAARNHFGDLVPYEAYFALKTVRNTVATWVPSMGDLLADDWFVYD